MCRGSASLTFLLLERSSSAAEYWPTQIIHRGSLLLVSRSVTSRFLPPLMLTVTTECSASEFSLAVEKRRRGGRVQVVGVGVRGERGYFGESRLFRPDIKTKGAMDPQLPPYNAQKVAAYLLGMACWFCNVLFQNPSLLMSVDLCSDFLDFTIAQF
jgi:hypothetical protein